MQQQCMYLNLRLKLGFVLVIFPEWQNGKMQYFINLTKNILKTAYDSISCPCADPENFLRGVQTPRRGLTENFNMAKINNLAIPGGGGVRTPCPPLDPPMLLLDNMLSIAYTNLPK